MPKIPFEADRQEQLRTLHGRGYVPGQMARSMGVSRRVALKWHEVLGLEPNRVEKSHRPTDAKFPMMADLHAQGLTTNAIKNTAEVGEGTVYRFYKVYGLEPNETLPPRKPTPDELFGKRLNGARFEDAPVRDGGFRGWR